MISDWTARAPSEWRQSCDAKLDKGRASPTEVRLTAGKLRRVEWDVNDEPDVGITNLT